MPKTQKPSDKIEYLYDRDIKIHFWEKLGNANHCYKRELSENVFSDRLLSPSAVCGIVDKSQALLYWQAKLSKKYLEEKKNTLIDDEVINTAPFLFKEKVKEEANVGTQVHSICESFIKTGQIEEVSDERVKNGVISFLNWVKNEDVKFVDSERIIYSITYDYVGTTDVLFTLGKEDHKLLHVGDFKTSKGIYSTMIMQVCSYNMAIKEENHYIKNNIPSHPYDESFKNRYLDYVFGNPYLIHLNKDEEAYSQNKNIFNAVELPLEMRMHGEECFKDAIELTRGVKTMDEFLKTINK